MSPSIFDLLHLPRELTLEFLATFARFEYALKRAGYTNASESSEQRNWNHFGRELALQSEENLARVFLAGEYRCHRPIVQFW
jgi:hypothetical protein